MNRYSIRAIPPLVWPLVALIAALILVNRTGQLVLAQPAAAPANAKLQYNRDIRPILAENCFACHGPDSAARKAGLRLDQRDAAIEKGAIAPKNLKESELIARILLPDSDEGVMPPVKSHKKLTAKQKETLSAWIQQGAEYEPHWSFIAPKRPAVPVVKDAKWVRNPIDAFVLAGLEKQGLQPAPEADRRTLARRLSLDLIGLPPTPEDVEAFVNDPSEKAYEAYIDKLMKSPHWGEHRGRYWLDAARYGDTHGIHFDNYREMWSYRDWVISAFNENKEFDQFTIEQLAGDLLPNPTVDQLVATGFNRCNITTSEGGAIDEEYLVLYTRDRTETVNQVYMGLTAGCAVCHDHKFDPLSQRDFYGMAAFFNNTTQRAMDGNVANTAPIIPVPKTEDRPRFAMVQKEMAETKAKMDARKALAKKDFEAWLKTANASQYEGQAPTAGLVFHALLKEGEGKTIQYTTQGKTGTATFKDGYDWGLARLEKQKGFVVKAGDALAFPTVGDFDKAQPFAVSTWLAITKRNVNGPILARMDEGNNYRGWDLWMQNDRVGMHIISSWQTDAIKVVARTPLQPNKWVHVTASYDGSGKSSGVKLYFDGELQPFDIEADSLKSTTRTTVPLRIGQRSGATRGIGVALQDLKIFDRQLTGIDAQQLAGSKNAIEILKKPADKRTAKEVEELYTWWSVSQDKPTQELAAAYRKLQVEEVAIRSRGTIAHISVEKPTPPEAYILFRGDYDKRREKVGPMTPKVLPNLDEKLPKNRLGFAQWLLTAEHPLTARVTVNRFWQEVFGTGLVRTSGDFGVTGELPSHPELLDWLAVEFREQGWDIQKFFKLIVTSSTYRQSAAVTAAKLEKDPQNRWLSRGPRFRMDAEMIRDYALAASGLLVPKIGGPSVKPYQPEGVWEAVAMIGSNTRNYKADSGPNLYRRSMYTFWKRAAPPASMEIFNAPNRETCAVRRDRTNTPIQALVTLNDIQFVEAARVLAEKALAAGKDDPARIDYISRRVLARPLEPAELKIVLASLQTLLVDFQAKPQEAKKLIAYGESKANPDLDPSQLAAWTLLCNQILNLDEVLNK
jgi:mono/diheme cytochrome c family protein